MNVAQFLRSRSTELGEFLPLLFERADGKTYPPKRMFRRPSARNLTSAEKDKQIMQRRSRQPDNSGAVGLTRRKRLLGSRRSGIRHLRRKRLGRTRSRRSLSHRRRVKERVRCLRNGKPRPLRGASPSHQWLPSHSYMAKRFHFIAKSVKVTTPSHHFEEDRAFTLGAESGYEHTEQLSVLVPQKKCMKQWHRLYRTLRPSAGLSFLNPKKETSPTYISPLSKGGGLLSDLSHYCILSTVLESCPNSRQEDRGLSVTEHIRFLKKSIADFFEVTCNVDTEGTETRCVRKMSLPTQETVYKQENEDTGSTSSWHESGEILIHETMSLFGDERISSTSIPFTLMVAVDNLTEKNDSHPKPTVLMFMVGPPDLYNHWLQLMVKKQSIPKDECSGPSDLAEYRIRLDCVSKWTPLRNSSPGTASLFEVMSSSSPAKLNAEGNTKVPQYKKLRSPVSDVVLGIHVHKSQRDPSSSREQIRSPQPFVRTTTRLLRFMNSQTESSAPFHLEYLLVWSSSIVGQPRREEDLDVKALELYEDLGEPGDGCPRTADTDKQNVTGPTMEYPSLVTSPSLNEIHQSITDACNFRYARRIFHHLVFYGNIAEGTGNVGRDVDGVVSISTTPRKRSRATSDSETHPLVPIGESERSCMRRQLGVSSYPIDSSSSFVWPLLINSVDKFPKQCKSLVNFFVRQLVAAAAPSLFRRGSVVVKCHETKFCSKEFSVVGEVTSSTYSMFYGCRVCIGVGEVGGYCSTIDAPVSTNTHGAAKIETPHDEERSSAATYVLISRSDFVKAWDKRAGSSMSQEQALEHRNLSLQRGNKMMRSDRTAGNAEIVGLKNGSEDDVKACDVSKNVKKRASCGDHYTNSCFKRCLGDWLKQNPEKWCEVLVSPCNRSSTAY